MCLCVCVCIIVFKQFTTTKKRGRWCCMMALYYLWENKTDLNKRSPYVIRQTFFSAKFFITIRACVRSLSGMDSCVNR
uniref:Putative secreted peptide n=1 Tax=Anopheles braziliensis TaxID=58242 RepID=A0A2M3ZN36_9DIPT